MVWWLLHTAVAGLEICDGEDNDGDGAIDEPPHLVFEDLDGDGHGDPESFVVLETACQTPTAVPPDDCNDDAPDQRPGIGDDCDGIDDDCDGEIDGGLCLPCLRSTYEGSSYLRCGLILPQRSWAEAEAYCESRGYRLAVPDSIDELGYLLDSTAGADRWVGLQDLDEDGVFLTWDDLVPPSLSWAPGEPLTADGPRCALVQNDMQTIGLVTRTCEDEAGWLCEAMCVERNWYLDDDGDGQGAGLPLGACVAPAGHVAIPGDCDDDDPDRHSTATEVCNGVDDDCDGDIDESASSEDLWYDDVDGDGAGDPATGVSTCSPAPDQVDVAGDCAPDDPDVHPLADEVCNSVDDDCDDATDEADDDLIDGTLFYIDDDDDGFGAIELVACSQPSGTVTAAGDCDDDDPQRSPGITEVCNGVDDDCSGTPDDITTGPTWYADADGDGLGDPADAVISCQSPPARVDNADDCDDTNASVTHGLDWFVDGDGDGYAGQDIVSACEQQPGTFPTAEDCDDHDEDVSPAALERCNGVDDDCDGSIDEEAVDAERWYDDDDGDGFGADSFTTSCEPVAGSVTESGDCDDDDAAVRPEASERCNGIDDDCDGLVDDQDDSIDGGTVYYADRDGDGYGTQPVESCDQPSGAVSVAGDCDDDDPERYPGAIELGDDGVDQDCDGADMAYTYGNGADCGCRSVDPWFPRFWRR